MKIEALVFVGLIWILPVMVGLWFSLGVWFFSERFDYRFAAVLRSLAVAGTFAPGYTPEAGFIPVPASVFLFFTPPDSTFLAQAEGAVPPILILSVLLLPIFILAGYFLHKGKIGLTHHSSGTG
jgi:hypothetical protein